MALTSPRHSFLPPYRRRDSGRLAHPRDLEEKEMYRPSLVTVVRILVIAAFVLPVALALIAPTGGIWGGGRKP